ncbi:UNVERIFIED_CONTAM: hypothetical protein DVV46_10700, partial [Lactobacillus paragasseri]|nr:hypothetical protein [Lactobacillus paragasseri]
DKSPDVFFANAFVLNDRISAMVVRNRRHFFIRALSCKISFAEVTKVTIITERLQECCINYCLFVYSQKIRHYLLVYSEEAKKMCKIRRIGKGFISAVMNNNMLHILFLSKNEGMFKNDFK